ncbi:MAG: PEP-CTERM sorting domain-containing protein [Planctomycetales bacterium]|nr:PEP-CTERM sorting domain-containing protein [Planctomycetales bacterium]
MRYFAFSFLILCSSILFAQDDDRSIVRAYKTDKAPEIDGVISDGEWDAAGPPVLVAFDDVGTAFPDDPFGGPSDLSFQYRAMWEEPWTVYFLFEVTDDIAMEESPSNAWERDQIEFFMDGDDLEGSDDLPTYQWWDNEEIYGKFGASRWEGVFEGNTGAMSQFIEDLYEDGFGATAVSMVTEAEDSDNYTVEYAVSLEPMFDYGTFDGTSTGDAGQIVANETVTKFAVCISDDDNFGDGTVGRSHTVCSYRAFDGADWRDSTAFADLHFLSEYPDGVVGDFNGNGERDIADIDLLTAAMASNDPAFDLTGDGKTDLADRIHWLETLSNTYVGDSDFNGEFNSSDFVAVFSAAKYETGQTASWNEGDWNGDGVFNSSDFVAAFTGAGYEQGLREGGLQVVPEPSSIVLALTGLLLFAIRRRWNAR